MKLIDVNGPLNILLSHRKFTFTDIEIKALIKVQKMACTMRDLMREKYGEDSFDMREDTQLAVIEHGIQDILDGMKLPL